MTVNQPVSNYGLEKLYFKPTQPCPVCDFPIGSLAGSKDAICQNCGFKDPCCE